MKVAVLTSDNHSWLLRGFHQQWRKYCGCKGSIDMDTFELEAVGFSRPADLPFELPFYSIGSFSDYPVHRWSDALIRYLGSCVDELVILLLEDYWLMRPINRQAIYDAYAYMMRHPDAIKFDLAADRIFQKQAQYVEPFGSIDVCEAKGDYSLSFQAAIFRRELLLKLLRPGETPWQTELNGSARLNETPYRVFGSYQWPINYMIVMNKGVMDSTGSWMYPARTLSPKDWQELEAANCLTPGEVK